ncbi:MATE family efflux transporter [Bradyrhizobium sp. 168]|uniref:MATE family efflux transporter n=1 Tax=Bradyrhizobium sp. 168 TaxID=2782639 RepID=UPI001FF81E36|nr:MATE family efflux transporter [Bradyrhizobium sp. 168]MCK1583960.1 MATE family efflux transporter [Bradyrhizobium sp. 168]
MAKNKPESSSLRRLLTQAVGRHLSVELSEIAKLAWPMVLTQVGQIIMMTTDVILIGRAGAEALAAAAVAGRIYLIGFILGAGPLTAIAPLVAQAFCAHNLGVVRRSLRMGLWAASLLSLPIVAFAMRGEQVLLALGQEADTARLAQQYLFGLAWGVAPALWFQAIRIFMGAVSRPEPVLGITVAAIPLNALLVYLLIYGKCGLPRLDLFGAGLATTLVNYGMCLTILLFTRIRRPFCDYHVLAHLWRFDWRSMRQLIVIGTPSSVGTLIMYGLFIVAALLAGLVNASALAAHQIAAQVAGTLFTISLGISMAAAVRVSQAVGRNDGPGIKRAGMVSMLLGIVIATMLTIAVVAARREIAALFLDESAEQADNTIRLAAKLLLLGASFFISDAAQIIATGSLRGMKDTRIPLLAAIAYWLIGFSLSYVLGLRLGLGAIGIWIGLSIATTAYAGLLFVRFQILANKLAIESKC